VLKSEKEELIKELNEKFARAKTAVVAEFSKVDVGTVTRLRKKFRESNVDYKVLKNTLAKRAAKGTSMEAVSDDFTGPVAVALSYDDLVAPAKVLSEFIKDMETIKVRSGMLEGKKLSANEVKALAKLPGINELRAKLLGLFNQPASMLARTIAAPGSQVARVIQAHADSQPK